MMDKIVVPSGTPLPITVMPTERFAVEGRLPMIALVTPVPVNVSVFDGVAAVTDCESVISRS